jgi:hypothetical protein
MYLVELEAGREELFESAEALASAIHQGQVGPKARIFHRASSSWVSITVHPEYKRVAAERAAAPLPPLTRKKWTFYGVESNGREIDEQSPATPPAAEQPAAATNETRRGLRGMFGRAFRSLSATSKASEATKT